MYSFIIYSDEKMDHYIAFQYPQQDLGDTVIICPDMALAIHTVPMET